MDGGIRVGWTFHPRWELIGGYQYYEREISAREITNRVACDIPYLAVARRW